MNVFGTCIINEIIYDMTNKMTCALSEDLYQPDQSSLGALWVAKDPMLLHSDNEDSDQTGWNVISLVLSCCGSYQLYKTKTYILISVGFNVKPESILFLLAMLIIPLTF